MSLETKNLLMIVNAVYFGSKEKIADKWCQQKYYSPRIYIYHDNLNFFFI